MTPQELLNLHQEAMDLSFEASFARVRKNEEKFQILMTQALEKEKEAAFFLKDKLLRVQYNQFYFHLLAGQTKQSQ